MLSRGIDEDLGEVLCQGEYVSQDSRVEDDGQEETCRLDTDIGKASADFVSRCVLILVLADGDRELEASRVVNLDATKVSKRKGSTRRVDAPCDRLRTAEARWIEFRA